MQPRVPLEGQVQSYWRSCRDLRLAREAGEADVDSVEDLADLAAFTNHTGLRAACLSHLHCDVVDLAGAI